jgi:hypothetical protein
MNYQIIKDEKLLREFIDWLPELKETEKYYLCLFARNKYCKELTHIKSDKAQLKRFVSDKERMFQKIKQLEIEEGWYMQKETPVPQKALALYITVNPREMWKASVNSLVKLANCIRDQNILVNPHQEVLSEIQRTRSRTCWIDFDIDLSQEDLEKKEEVESLLSILKGYVNPEAVQWLQTRGGYHMLINPSKIEEKFKNSFYNNISNYTDQSGDNMSPVPGCTQGDYIPHFITL